MKLGKKPQVRVFLPRSAVLLLASLLLLHSPLEAAGLIDVYRSDPAFEAARHALEAVQQRIPQARAGLRPTVALPGGNNRNRSNVDFGQSAPAQDRDIRSWNWTLQLTQPFLRMQNHYAYDEAEFLPVSSLSFSSRAVLPCAAAWSPRPKSALNPALPPMPMPSASYVA
jgi:outer membrane protein TolC